MIELEQYLAQIGRRLQPHGWIEVATITVDNLRAHFTEVVADHRAKETGAAEYGDNGAIETGSATGTAAERSQFGAAQILQISDGAGRRRIRKLRAANESTSQTC